MKAKLLDVLAQRPLLCDGAMGTLLMSAGLAPGECGLLWNVERPEAVEDIHRRYAAAGCDLATTNTFEGTRQALGKHGAGGRVAELNREGVARARKAAPDLWVLGDMGPFGDFMEPLGDTSEAEAEALFREQAEALASADALIIETMTDPNEMAVAIRAARTIGLPVVASFAFDRADGVTFRTMMGADVASALAMAVDSGADVVGANCGSGMGLDDYRRLADHVLAAAQGKPTILQPNAGAPQLENGVAVYRATPVEMAALAAALVDAGISIVGGCCGTTPDHIAAMRGAIPVRV